MGRRANNTTWSHIRRSVTLGIVTVFLVAAAGAAFLLLRAPRFAATATFVVLPGARTQPALASGFFDTLDQGQFLGTVAELVRAGGLDAAAQRAGIPAPRDAELAVTVVPNSDVVEVTATAGTAATAERLADGAVAAARTRLDGLASPFAMTAIRGAAGHAEPAGTSRSEFAAAVAVLAVVAGVGVQQLNQQLHGLRLRTTRAVTPGEEWAVLPRPAGVPDRAATVDGPVTRTGR